MLKAGNNWLKLGLAKLNVILDSLGHAICILLLSDLSVILLILLEFYWISLGAFLAVLLILPVSLLSPFPVGLNALFSRGHKRASLARIYALWNATSISNICDSLWIFVVPDIRRAECVAKQEDLYRELLILDKLEEDDQQKHQGVAKSVPTPKVDDAAPSLQNKMGPAGLALHYANIVLQIDSIDVAESRGTLTDIGVKSPNIEGSCGSRKARVVALTNKKLLGIR
ncbi:hypothetical protein CTI12_AA136370 [Artemisia annua]|uniref:Uncharacterized protein n=1 Tax=Artemisia annua TaxID=35608 RepID=A0A2U1PMW9_ARTAN|nr:hypothetical protein CTI12_AA136370 [Artemisia annua]